jgi:putative membrane protein
MITTALSNKKFYVINGVVSVVALAFLVWLIYFQSGSSTDSMSRSILPAINATLNSISAILIVGGIVAIRQRRETMHRNFMIGAFVSSTLFLLCYIYYHSMQGDTKFLGEGLIRPVYFAILISHIALSAVMLPLILSSMFFGLTNRRKSHRKVAKWTYPIWLYVSVTGVVIFFLLRAYS